MGKLCRSCKESISENALVCTYCGSPQTLFGHFAAALKWIGDLDAIRGHPNYIRVMAGR